MFQKSAFFLIIVALAIIQVAVLLHFFGTGMVPNLVLIVVVYWTIRAGFEENWKKAVLAGLILDLAYGWAIGINILSLSVVSFLVGSLSKRFSVSQRGWGFIMTIGLVGLGALVNSIIVFSVVRSFGWLKGLPLETSMIYPLGIRMIWEASLTSAFFVFLYWPMEKMEKFLDSYRGERFKKTRFLK